MNRKSILFRKPDGSIHLEVLTLNPLEQIAAAEKLVAGLCEAVDLSTAQEITRRRDAVSNQRERLANAQTTADNKAAAAKTAADQILTLRSQVPEDISSIPHRFSNRTIERHRRSVARALDHARRAEREAAMAKEGVAARQADLDRALADASDSAIKTLQDGADRFRQEKESDLQRLKDRMSSDQVSRDHATTLRDQAAAQWEEAKKTDPNAPRPYYLDLTPVAFDVPEIPDPYYLDAWRWDKKAGRAAIDLPAALDVQRKALRAERKPMLEALDSEYIRALEEAGDTAAVAAKKKALRDVTQHPKLIGETDLERLKTMTVASLTKA